MSIPEGWRVVKLGDIIKIKHGYAFSGKYITTEETKNILVTPGNFKIGGGFKQDKLKFLSSNIYPAEYKFNGGEIVITMTDLSKETDTLGYSAKIPKDGKIYLHNQRVGLITNININISYDDFIYWLMRSNNYQNYIANSANGTSVMHTSPTKVEAYSFFLPLLPEQKAIAGVLSSLDDKIDLLHRQNKTLEAMAETLFRQWFIKEAQDDWGEKTIGHIFTLKGGGTPSTKNVTYWNGDINWTSPRDLSDATSLFLCSTSRKITQAGLSVISSGLLPENTLLMSSRAPIGYLAITDIKVAINQGYIAIMEDSIFNSEYMYLWCKANLETIKNAGNGSVFQEISKSNFKQLSFLIPPENKVRLFNICSKKIFQKIKSNTYQIQTLEKLRDTLLPRLMRGEIRVQYDNTAS